MQEVSKGLKRKFQKLMLDLRRALDTPELVSTRDETVSITVALYEFHDR